MRRNSDCACLSIATTLVDSARPDVLSRKYHSTIPALSARYRAAGRDAGNAAESCHEMRGGLRGSGASGGY
jgi:hypothetical protein